MGQSPHRDVVGSPLVKTGPMSEADCEFCPPRVDGLVVVENGTCVGLWDREQTPLVVPRAHRRTAFDLTAEEVRDTFGLLRQLKAMVEDIDPPDGWNIGWNLEAAGGQVTFHAHCHLLPRYSDEPYAGRGIRWLYKQPENARPSKGRPE